MKFYTAEKVSRIITEDLPLPTHEYTDEEFSVSDDGDVADTVPMPCPLDEREELHLPEQVIDDTSLFAVNVTSDVSNQEQQSQIDDGQLAQSASSCESSVVVENNQYNQNRYWKKKSKNAMITFYVSLICILRKNHLEQNLLIEESLLVFCV